MSKTNHEHNHPEHEKFQLSQKVVLYDPKEKKFLLVRDGRPETSYYKKYGPWDLPGGRVQVDEDPVEGLERELQEEIGDIAYELKEVVSGCLMEIEHKGTVTKRTVLFTLGMYSGGEIQLSEEHDQFEWKSAQEIEKDSEYKPWLKTAVQSALKHLGESEYLIDLKRVQADFENYKKRQAESQKELGGYLIEKLVLDIVPVLDNFRSATMHVPPEQKDSPWVVGIQYIEKQLETVLVDNGVTPIDAEPGEAFDPNLHEAVSSESDAVEAEGGEPVEPKGHKIAKVLQKGYKVGTKVVRPARVTVK